MNGRARTVRSTWVEIDDVRIHVEESGRGADGGSGDRPTVVVLHGFTGSIDAMACLTAPLARDCRVLAVDLVGHGRSEAPTDVGPYAMSACVRQVAAVIEERTAAAETVHLAGYSMGGRAALSFAVAHPERVSSLHLVGATAGLATEAERAERRAADAALADRIIDDGLEWFVDHWMAVPLFASQARLGNEALATARAERLTSDPAGLANSLRGMGTGSMPPLHDDLGRVTMPVQLIVGAEDEKFRAIARDLAELLPDARIDVIDDAGHAAHLEQPAAVVDTMLEHVGLAR